MNPFPKNILEIIGNTPLIRLNKVVEGSPHEYYAKLEYLNPGGSVKDRMALAMIEEAEKRGDLKKGGTIVEATSGNTGAGLAMVAAIKGYKALFVMPDKISEEKRAILKAYGAEVMITPTELSPEDPGSFYSIAQKMVKERNAFYSNQYHNPDNVEAHYKTTGPEIWQQSQGLIDVLVAGAGTGGTISGVGRFLKEKKPETKIICCDPEGSILSDLYYFKEVKTPPHPYKVEGIGEDMLPQNVHFNVIDDFVKVDDKSAFQMTRRLAREEGLLVGPSSALAVVGAMKYAQNLKNKSRILIIMADSGKSYISKAFNDEWMQENQFLD